MSASQFPPLQSKPSSRHCPNCSNKMALYTLPGHYNSAVDIDVCMDCNAIWFDQLESSMLSPDGTVMLFQLIHQRGGAGTDAARKFSEGLRCAACGDSMRLTHDTARGTRFTYQACRHGHGRLTTFYNFLAEKQFVRELTPAERSKLAATVQQIRCSGCGAPVNIGMTDACEYCRAPVSVFDREAAKKAIDHYLQERQKQAPYRPGSGGERRETARSDERWSGYDRAELGADILYALGRAATRGAYGAGRTVPVAGAGAAAASTLETFPDATSALFGGATGSVVADGMAAGAGTAVSEAAGAFSGAGMDVAADALPATGGALPSAAEALFGSASDNGFGSAGEAAGSLGGDIASVFGDATASGMGDTVESVSSGVMDVVADGGPEFIGEAVSSAGGILDLVTDGIGSLLGSLFD